NPAAYAARLAIRVLRLTMSLGYFPPEAHPMRTSLLSAFLILACTLPVAGQEKAKPNTLTPKEIADGWILLFDGATTFGWQRQGPQDINGGQWTIDGGASV